MRRRIRVGCNRGCASGRLGREGLQARDRRPNRQTVQKAWLQPAAAQRLIGRSIVMGNPIEGNIAVITGASSGLGAATARYLAARGAIVVLGRAASSASRLWPTSLKA